MQQIAFQKKITDKYRSIGDRKFYRFLLSDGVEKLVRLKDEDYIGPSPEIEFLECANSFLILYRRDNDEILMDISRVFRKAAHRIYSLMRKKEMIPQNKKFLNLVSRGRN